MLGLVLIVALAVAVVLAAQGTAPVERDARRQGIRARDQLDVVQAQQ
jgi:hypothetical protein